MCLYVRQCVLCVWYLCRSWSPHQNSSSTPTGRWPLLGYDYRHRNAAGMCMSGTTSALILFERSSCEILNSFRYMHRKFKLLVSRHALARAPSQTQRSPTANFVTLCTCCLSSAFHRCGHSEDGNRQVDSAIKETLVSSLGA